MNLIEDTVARFEAENYAGDMPIHNKQTMRSRLTFLLAHAKVNNFAWKELEHYGIEGDGSIEDEDCRLT